MRHISALKFVMQLSGCRTFFLIILILSAGLSTESGAATLGDRYPGLSTGLLQSAVLTSLDDETLLTAEGLTIRRSKLMEGIRDHDPGLRAQLEKNLMFVLEQEAVMQILLLEARKAGISDSTGDDDRMIQALFEQRTRDMTISDGEARAFYEANKAMVGNASFEQAADSIRQYLLQDKKQQAVTDYIAGLGNSKHLRINQKWVETQSRLALDNPVDKARHSGKPTMVEFGAAGCVPCDMMQPILEQLRKDYPKKLNVVFVHVREEQILSARYGIRSIPVQVFFDAKGKEVFRHVGFFPQTEVDMQLAKMGVQK